MTREEYIEALKGLVMLLEQPNPVPDPEPEPEPDPEPEPSPAGKFNFSGLVLRGDECNVPVGSRVANVKLSLNEPANQTMVVRYLTKNGTAIQDRHFRRADGYLTFHPGEQHKTIEVTLLQDLGDTFFTVSVGWPTNHPALNVATPTIRVDMDGPSNNERVHDNVPLPAKPSSLKLAFSEDFSNAQFTDSGFLTSGVPCWRSRMSFAREHVNYGLGYFSDPVLHPGTTPFTRGADGNFALQAQYHPNGIKDAQGNVLTRNGQPFVYSTPMITTEKLFNKVGVGSYVEARVKIPKAIGLWPAVWLLVHPGHHWPAVELDMFEGFFSNSDFNGRLGTTVHWENSSGKHQVFSSLLPHEDINLDEYHTWGLYWGKEQLTFYCDDRPYFAVPNVWPASRTTYIKINVGVGGLGGNPNSNNFPVRMPIEFVRVYQ